MKLSVIVAFHNAEATIAETLEGLASQQWDQPWEVLLVDNRSRDTSRQIIERYRGRLPNLRILEASEQLGHAYALNAVLNEACGESIAICDADDVVGAGWLPAIGAALEQHDLVGARVEVERLNHGWVLQSRGNNQRSGLQSYRYPTYLPHVGGCSLAIKRHVLIALGGFNPQIPYLFDTDICWRAQLCGITLHFAADAVVHVRYRSRLGQIYAQAKGYAVGNVWLYRRYRRLGMPRITPGMSLKSWRNLLLELTRVRSKGQFAAWVWSFAHRVGRVQGSLKYRVLAI